MTTEPYASAQRVFWTVDNGPSHAGKHPIDRLQNSAEPGPRQLPVQAS